MESVRSTYPSQVTLTLRDPEKIPSEIDHYEVFLIVQKVTSILIIKKGVGMRQFEYLSQILLKLISSRNYLVPIVLIV